VKAVLTEATATARIKQEAINHGVHRIGDDALQNAGFALALFLFKTLAIPWRSNFSIPRRHNVYQLH
jgi:hypothetical protein